MNVKKIYNKACKIFNSNTLSWEEKYDKIFSDKISVKMRGHFSYYDPDTTYEEDVRAFMSAFSEYMDECDCYKETIA